MKIKFVFEKETKNTIRYTEVEQDGRKIESDQTILGTMYVKKSAAAGRKEIVIDFPIDGE